MITITDEIWKTNSRLAYDRAYFCTNLYLDSYFFLRKKKKGNEKKLMNSLI